MANINDFKIVQNKSLAYSQFLTLSKEIGDIERQRMGFYLLVLDCVTGQKDPDDLIDMIIDSKFQKLVFGVGNDDLGVDAVFIDEEKKIIQLFNFKYRENFKNDNSTKETDVYDSSRFLAAVCTENTSGLDPKTLEKVKAIIEKLHSPELYKIELLMVANVCQGFANNKALELYKELFDISVVNITLDNIISYVSDYPVDQKAVLLLDSNAVLTYEIDSYSTARSFVVKLSLADVVRITCTNKEFRKNPNVDCSQLESSEIEISLLFDNVRGYLGNTKYNKNITNCLENEPTKFFMYNNGITITAKNISSRAQNGNKKFSITIDGYQIVNGGANT